MRNFGRLLFTILAFSITSSSTAQVVTEDIVELVNGSFYRGDIIEMVPDSFVVILTPAGNQYRFNHADILKIDTKILGTSRVKRLMKTNEKLERQIRYKRPQFVYRDSGYFFEIHLHTELVKFGFRTIHGYRFSQFAQLGLSVGLELIPSHDLNYQISQTKASNYEGGYVPIHLNFQGDLMRKQTTPFYYVELGYTAAVNLTSDRTPPYREGGVSGGFGFGVKFISTRRAKLTLSAGLDIKSLRYMGYGSYQNGYYQRNPVSDVMFFPGLRLSVGI